MNKELFVQNIKKYCKQKGVKPTVACRESGVSSSFISNIESRNQTPSVEKVQMLAEYLGVTTSELLGEKETPTPIVECIRSQDPKQGDFIVKFNSLSPDDQEEILAIIDVKLTRNPPKT